MRRDRFYGGTYEEIDGTDLSRVYDRYSNSRSTWEVVTRRPVDTENPPVNPGDFWVASCRASGPSGSARICLSAVGIDDANVTFYLPEVDLQWIGQISDYIAGQVRSWRTTAPMD